MGKHNSEESYSSEEAARRRDAVVKAMIATPPTPHVPKAKLVRKRTASRAKARQKAK